LLRVRESVILFTAADLQSGLIRYHHQETRDNDYNNDNSVHDRFAFVVCVDSHCVHGVVNVRVTAEGLPAVEVPSTVLPPPAVLVEKLVVDHALGSAIITPSHLNASCAHCSEPINITYFVMTAPRYGQLLKGTGNRTVASFSQCDLTLDHMTYLHVDPAHLSDSIQLSAAVRSRDDDVIRSEVWLEIEVKPSGTAIALSVSGNVSVAEGERAFVTENQLRIQYGSEVGDVEIVVVRLPVHGRIQIISGQKLRARTSFLLSEVSKRVFQVVVLIFVKFFCVL